MTDGTDATEPKLIYIRQELYDKLQADYDRLLAEADALRKVLRQAPLDTENDEDYTIYVEGRMRWDTFRKGLK